MAAFCIDTNSPAFKDTAKKLGVSEFELEQIAYKYGNQEGTFGQFPSDDYIKEDLNGVPNYDATEAQAELWKLRYSKPKEFDTVEDMQAAKTDALQYFSEDAVRTFVNADGKYELRVGEQDNEYQRIKEQAIKDGTFLKVRNKEGELVDSNLSEPQWIQVRSKAFKRWFGDWENDPANASKVVDENGEPLVVYHGSNKSDIKVFSNKSKRYNVHEDGLFFSESRESAETYAFGDTPTVYGVFLNIRNMEETSYTDDDTIESLRERENAAIKSDKNDGVKMHTYDKIGPEIQYVVKNSTQIKSAETNRGTFSEYDPIISYFGENREEKVIEGKLGVNKEQLISLLGSTMYKGNIQSVAVKELIQNAFDAVKIADSKGNLSEKPKIHITLNDDDRTVTVEDNGTGMSPEIVQKAFFTIGGSYKGDNVDNRLKSGGLGLAKMAFLFSSDFVEVSTVKDGIKTYVRATPEEIQSDNFKIITSKTTEKNGTTVTVKIPETYVDKDGTVRSIAFSSSYVPFLNEPMIGNVDVSVTSKYGSYEKTETYDKNKVPDKYISIGKAKSKFGDIEIYLAPTNTSGKYIHSKVLISGLHQFNTLTEAIGASKARFDVIINILPTVGVQSEVYPINNQREGYRPTIEAEVKDIDKLLIDINRTLEIKSLQATFDSAMSMNVESVSKVERKEAGDNSLKEAVDEIKKKYSSESSGIRKLFSNSKGESSNDLDLSNVRKEREKEEAQREKERESSLDTSGVHYNRSGTITGVDTSKLDINKPLFHNNTTMVIDEDGQGVLKEFGKLMLELKSLYVQTYKDAGIQSRFGNIIEHLNTQFWGVSFDKNYGGVNINPKVINMLTVNPFYRINAYPGVDTALALTEYITHLIIHEFNHNYAGGEGAEFTGRFPATYAEFAGIGKQFNKEWKNKLYILIRDNLETFIKYNQRYEQATNLGESFEGNKINSRENGESKSPENDGRDISRDGSRGNVSENGRGSTEISGTPQQVQQSSFAQTAEFYSGAAEGSDTAWATEARKLGIKVTEYTRASWNALSPEWRSRLGLEYESVARDLARPVIPLGGRGDVEVRRDMMQADKADAIFAIGIPVKPGQRGAKYINRANHEVVDGGTGYAVQRGIQRGIPVYLYDRVAKQWKMWDGNSQSFVATEEPTLTPHAAVIGTRGDIIPGTNKSDISEGEKQVIRSVLNKTVNQSRVPSQASEVIDIWAGSNPTNADLSNFAYRWFTIPMGFRLPNGTFANIPWQVRSVEAAFQALKVNYTNRGTPEEEVENNEIKISILSGRWQDEREDGAAVKRLGRKIKNFNQPAWIRDRQAIMKELIKMSFQQNPQALQRLLDTGDAILTHNRETSEWKTEFPRILMEVRSELRAAQQVTTLESTTQEEPLWAPPKVERDFHEREVTVVTQMDNLTKSGILTTTEIVDEANKAMDWISDQLTQYLEDPSIVWDKLDDTKKEGTTREEVIAKVSQMSRKELLEYIGVSNIIRFYTEEVLSLVESDEAAGIVGNEDIFSNFEDSDYEKLDLIKENISGLIQYGHTRFLAREGFGFQISDIKGEDYVVTETDTENVIDVDNFNVPEDVVEEVGNQQEHWMIESATRDIMANASVQVKQAIADCFILEDNGKVNPDGTIAYDIAKDKLNRNKRVDPVKAVRSIVRWTQGALTVSQMIDKLSVKVKGNPWVSQIVSRLQDTSGKESDFQSQFFNTFCKHFQAYSIVKRRADGTYYTMLVNVHPALNDALNNIIIQHKTGGFALVTEEGKVVSSNLDTFKGWTDTLWNFAELDEDNREGVIDMISNILYGIGLPQSREDIARILDNKVKNTVWENADNIVSTLEKNKNTQNYNPFEFGNDGIRNYVKQLIQPFTNALEDTMVSAVFDGGKMYQSNITPSWTTKLFQKMHLPDREFKEFVLSEFGSSEWFIDPNINMLEELPENAFDGLSEEEKDQLTLETKVNYIGSHPNIWRLPWLRSLINMTEEQRQEVFQHKVQLNFDQQRYMKGMDAPAYVLSCFTEYFGESSTGRDSGAQYAYYRFPMLSNKPSNEFVRFYRHSDIGTRDFLGDGAKSILRGYYKIFLQEISRIQTVEMRNLKEGDEGYIANFDANEGKGSGLKFNFLDYLNKYLNGSAKDTALGKLIDRKLHAENEAEALSAEEERTLEGLVRDEIAKHLFDVADRLIAKYKENGVFEALKNIEGIDNSDYGVQAAVTEFAWNDNYAQANLLELLVTDKAFYKNEEDLQKRLAQVHSPGIRGNWEALDFGDEETGRAPERISDGKLRVVKLADFLAIKDSITENLTVIFNKKIEEAYGDEKQALEDLRDNIIKAYEEINVVDGQAFVSPTAYRKHAFAFGEWTREDEKVYKRLLNGEFNIADIQRVFNPRKPFTYGKTTKRSDPSINTPIKSLRYGVQYKNSEYLLILADAIMRGQETQRPNILGAIFDVMEESYKTDPKEGIDFVIFESGVKTGLMGAISLNDFVDNPDGRALAYKKLIDNIYQNGQHSAYNENYVDILDAEDYTEQQVVPEHFMHGSLQWGSQIRAMMPSDLENVYDGQDVVYEYKDPATGETIEKSAEEIRRAWEENTAKMVNLSIAELKKELGLDGSMSIADSNVVISKILQREILSNPRYGVDLLLACSVDAEGNFRIPLGDPIQSKRVEQLLSSIVKNRINKQKVAGGTLVEVTNFGTSKRLNIRFKDKSDPTGRKLLDTRVEYLAKGHTEDEFKEYVKNNQGGIAYYECYAPAWARELFLKFADEKGNIDVEAIEMLDPDLLKMFGYRIPTEDKYSTAPYKIVGFLPKEAGDGFMQPWETTVIDGSDFDVDKKNLMRMALEIKSALLSKKEFYEKNGILENSEEAETKYRNYRRKAISAKTILEKIGDSGDISLSESEIEGAEWYAESRKNRRLDDALISKYNAEDEAIEDSDRDDSLIKVHKSFAGNEIEYQSLQDTIDMLEAREELTSEDEKRIKRYKAKLKRIDAKYSERQQVIDKDYSRDKEGAIKSAKREKKRAIVKTILQDGVFRDSSTIPANQRPLFLAVKKAYIEAAFKVEKPKVGTKDYYNNLMFNMQWAIATHASTADKMLNPGNFDPQKKMGYMVEAHRMGYDWDTLQKMKIKDMKDLVSTSKNLMDFDVQTQFYSQNAVAGQILGIFAVAKSAHAMFESRNYGVVVDRTFFIDGKKFGGMMRYDQKYDRKGNLIGKTIGSLVGASADAVKDPVLNLMNINKETVNVLNTALRLGMDFDTVALLLSTKAVTNVLNAYRRNSLIAKTSFDAEIKKAIRELEKNPAIGKDSPLQQQNLTIEEMVNAVNNPTVETAYKILNALRGLSEISKTAQPLTDLSRLNSITSAPGPLYINTISSDRKVGPQISMNGIVKIRTAYKDATDTPVGIGSKVRNDDIVGDEYIEITEDNLEELLNRGTISAYEEYEDATREMVFDELPSLRAFYESYNIVKDLFKKLNFTTASAQFQKVLDVVPDALQFTLYNNDKLLSNLADFFQSYLLVQSGAIKHTELHRYVTEFVSDYMKGKLTADEKVKNNPLIQAIQPKLISKKGEPDRYALSIDTTGMEQSEKDALSAGWTQLEKDDPELSHKLFAYNFFRGGIGFNPKTFMALMPIQVKESLGGYLETFTILPAIDDAYSVFDQWVRNNWGNTDLVTRVTDKACSKETTNLAFTGKELYKVYNSPYIRVVTKEGDFMFRETSRTKDRVEYTKVTPLGNNKEYLEMFPTNVVNTAAAVFDNMQRGRASLEAVESDIAEQKVDSQDDFQTVEEQSRELADFYQDVYGREDVGESEKAAITDSFEKANTDLEIQTDESKFEEILDQFC